MNHFFAYIDRMRYIERWALMRNCVRENIQEHSHQVAVLAHALAVIRNEFFGGQVDAGAVAAAALYHDAGEILTGDMPTPIKYFNPEIREAYRKVEEVADQKLLAMLPRRCGGGGAGEGGGQAQRPYQMPGGAEGRKRGVPAGGAADGGGAGELRHAGTAVFP